MKDIYLNYKDIQFLLGCTGFKAKEIIYKHLDWNDKKETLQEAIKASHFVCIERFSQAMSSFSDKIHGKPIIQLIVSEMRDKGISCTLKHEVLEDVKNVIRGAVWKIWFIKKNIN